MNSTNKIFDSVVSLFPTPVYFSKLQRQLSKKEKDLIIKCSKKIIKNESNVYSKNTYVLETASFKKLKKEILLRVQHYFDKVLCYKNVKPYITQSWLNYNVKNTNHHKHDHPNSLVSGVFYVNADKKNDTITFLNQNYLPISPQIREFNTWNASNWDVSVETGAIFLFPSSLMHKVKNKKENGTRISLSFNVFIKGILGEKEKLTELIL